MALNTATCFKCSHQSQTKEPAPSAFEYCPKCKKSTHHLVSHPQKTTEYKNLADLKEKQKV